MHLALDKEKSPTLTASQNSDYIRGIPELVFTDKKKFVKSKR
jgi:hypothetical protein